MFLFSLWAQHQFMLNPEKQDGLSDAVVKPTWEYINIHYLALQERYLY